MERKTEDRFYCRGQHQAHMVKTRQGVKVIQKRDAMKSLQGKKEEKRENPPNRVLRRKVGKTTLQEAEKKITPEAKKKKIGFRQIGWLGEKGRLLSVIKKKKLDRFTEQLPHHVTRKRMQKGEKLYRTTEGTKVAFVGKTRGVGTHLHHAKLQKKRKETKKREGFG